MKKLADISSFQALQDVAHAEMGIPTVCVFNMSEEDPIYKACNAWDWEGFKELVLGRDAELDKFIEDLDRKQQNQGDKYSEDFLSSIIDLDYKNPDLNFWELWARYKDDLLWPRLEWQYDEEEADKEVYPFQHAGD